MIKNPLTDLDVKDYWRWKDRTKVTRFLLADGQVRGACSDAWLAIREMASNHGTDPLETFLLGQAYLAASLLTIGLKGQDRLNLKIECDGPMRGLSVDVNGYGELRGWLYGKPLGSFSGPVDFASLQGQGFLTVTKTLENKTTPVSGTVPLVSDYLGSNLEHYFIQSEQNPTALLLDVDMDEDGLLMGAGGWILQAMPGADPQVVEDVIFHFREKARAPGPQAEQDILNYGAPWNPQILGHVRTEFFCACSRERFSKFLQAFSREEKKDILEKGPFPLDLTCHNCASVYSFPKEELQEMFRE